MEYLIDIGAFAIAWVVGNLFSVSITTIGCCLFCGLPIAQKLKPYSDCIYVKSVKSVYIGSILRHAAILAAASWAVVTYAPPMMRYGFFFSYAFTVLIGYRAWGRNEQNISDCAALIEKHFVRGKEEEANAALFKVATADGLEREALNKYLEILCALFLIAGIIYAVYCSVPKNRKPTRKSPTITATKPATVRAIPLALTREKPFSGDGTQSVTAQSLILRVPSGSITE